MTVYEAFSFPIYIFLSILFSLCILLYSFRRTQVVEDIITHILQKSNHADYTNLNDLLKASVDRMIYGNNDDDDDANDDDNGDDGDGGHDVDQAEILWVDISHPIPSVYLMSSMLMICLLCYFYLYRYSVSGFMPWIIACFMLMLFPTGYMFLMFFKLLMHYRNPDALYIMTRTGIMILHDAYVGQAKYQFIKYEDVVADSVQLKSQFTPSCMSNVIFTYNTRVPVVPAKQ
eukprot:TRINITY_DN4850_c1_g1_i2.p1 TRINITY_DN4850_c1_g1~~TRINITY_DN4850_c1_g1_i2.p1  ORF type:complete len:231 (+),score=32.04 TRINITY_DN4850_c1_g1_i2:254-946(+)